MAMVGFARFVRERRQSLGLTQGQVAEHSGLKRSYISLLEGMQIQMPSAEKLARLAKGLHVELNEMYQVIGAPAQGTTRKPPFEAQICDQYGVDLETARIMRALLDAFLTVRNKQSVIR